MKEIVDKFKALPPAARYGAGGFVGVFALALAAGLASKPNAPTAPAQVAPSGAVMPAAQPNPAQAQPAQAQPAAAPAAPASVGSMSGVLRPAKAFTEDEVKGMKQCVKTSFETSNDGQNFSDVGATTECDTSINFNNRVQKIPDAIKKIVTGARKVRVSHSGFIKAKDDGPLNINLMIDRNTASKCAVFASDKSTPVIFIGSDEYSNFSQSVISDSKQVNLQAGWHEIVLTCTYANTMFNSDSVTSELTAKGPGDALPSLVMPMNIVESK